jgi:hypothetical protein
MIQLDAIEQRNRIVETSTDSNAKKHLHIATSNEQRADSM